MYNDAFLHFGYMVLSKCGLVCHTSHAAIDLKLWGYGGTRSGPAWTIALVGELGKRQRVSYRRQYRLLSQGVKNRKVLPSFDKDASFSWQEQINSFSLIWKTPPASPVQTKFFRVPHSADHKMHQRFRRQSWGGRRTVCIYEGPSDRKTQVNFIQDFPGESSASFDLYNAVIHAITMWNYDAVLSGAMDVRRRRKRSWCWNRNVNWWPWWL